MFVDRVTSLLKVVETGSFTEAARELYLTQPAVTRHVKALESELGVTLIDRSVNPVALTEAGALALGHLRAILAEERALLADLEPFAGRAREFVVCLGSDVMNFEQDMFARLMRETAAIYGPNIRVTPASSEKADTAGVLDGSIDLLLGSVEHISQASPHIRCQPLFKARFGLVCSRNDKLAGKTEPACAADLNGRALFLLDDNAPSQQWVLDDLEGRPDIKWTKRKAATLSSVLPMIELGAGVAFVAMHGGLSEQTVFVPYELPEECTIGLCWSKKRQTPRLLRLVEAFAAAYADPAQTWDQHPIGQVEAPACAQKA